MDFLSNFEYYFEYFKIYVVVSAILLVLLFIGYLTMSLHLSKIERKIDYLMGEDLQKYNELCGMKK